MLGLLGFVHLGLMLNLFLLMIVDVHAPRGCAKVCPICVKGEPNSRVRNLKWYGQEMIKPCGELFTPPNECDSQVPIRIYFCNLCEAIAWVPNGLCNGLHNGKLPPERLIQKPKPAEPAESGESGTS
ncbi:hypothetical protein PGTUg99_021208 [Puccinia graminis f. sp. tritici]|uniref:Secreted protein n=1 Tax=Puccinia graminis f. sp. tritici TaxID=56615 RepID=A0A5B0SD36_PUCGR|nr:hypothetical protein PGTUg99_021208 [Puccinia graminis f. sp. tritici]